MGLTPRDSLSIRSTLATTSHAGDTDSEQSEETPDVSSELSEEDITDAFALIAMSMSSLPNPWSMDGEQGITSSAHLITSATDQGSDGSEDGSLSGTSSET